MKNNQKILYFAPIAPPFAGPEIANKMLLNTSVIKNNKQIIFLKANIRSKNQQKGKLDLDGFKTFLLIYLKILWRFLNPKVSVFYFMLSSSKIGFLRDSIYILTAWLFRKKVFGHYRGSNFDGFYRNQSVRYQKYIKMVVNKIDHIIIQGKCISPRFENIYPKERLKVLYNGLTLNDYIIKPLQTDDSCFTIFFMGHLWFPKGFYDLILAYQILYKRYNSKIRLIFAGENIGYKPSTIEFLNGTWREKFLNGGPQIAEFIQTFVKNASQFHAEYLGLVYGEQKIKAFQKADIFVLPSYTEGFSVACLEAMTMGLPVIVTPVGAMPEVVIHGENGLITPIGDHHQLADNIEFLLKNDELRKKIAKNNIQHVRKNFDIEVIAQKLINILEGQD